MTSSPAPGQRLGKLALMAFLCALPFFATIVYLERQVEHIDTLPADEYKDLTWAPDGRSLVLLHRPLTEDAPTELWGRDANDFTHLASLPAGKVWRVTGHSLGEEIVLGATADGPEQLAILEGGQAKTLEPGTEWTLLPTQGKGLFYAKEVNDVPFGEMVEVEDAPEVSPEPEATPAPAASPATPLRSGLQIGRYNRATGAPDVILTIPYSTPAEKPKVLLVRESPDARFVALVTQFGESGSAGLWVFDSEASRLLWTRVITDLTARGIDWSPSSVALALCDGDGVVVLDNVMNIESTRYEAQALGAVHPLFVEEDTLYLVGRTSVHRLDRQAGKAEVIFDTRARGLDATGFAVNPTASKAAFLASPKGYPELLTYSLEEREQPPVVYDLPGSLRRKAQGSLTYQVGSALRSARQFWID